MEPPLVEQDMNDTRSRFHLTPNQGVKTKNETSTRAAICHPCDPRSCTTIKKKLEGSESGVVER